MACSDLDFLWKEYFRDPSLFWDNRSSKSGPDFRHKQTSEPLWVNGWHNPPWVKQELKRSGVRQEEVCLWKAADKAVQFQDHLPIMELMKDCGKQKDLHRAGRIHADLLKKGSLERDTYLGNALLTMYVKCGALTKAQEVFNELPARNVVTYNVLISGHVQHGLHDEALRWFRELQDGGLSPDAVTFTCILKACRSMKAAKKGEEIHAELHTLGLLEKDIVLGTALVDMYAQSGALARAQEVFNELPARNVVTWNALISGYTQHGLGKEALGCYKRMCDEGVFPDTVTFICILKACGIIEAAQRGEEIHAEVHRQGLLEKDILLGTAVVDMYAKCGKLAKAQEVFNELQTRDVVMWNALIGGYAQNGVMHEVLSSYGRMQEEGFVPDSVTFICILKACGSERAAEMGEQIHMEIRRQGLLRKDVELGNALVDMYVKCGMCSKAEEAFNELPIRNVITWNSLISGHAQEGLHDEALRCFGRMQEEHLTPDIVTFICVLRSCGSTGAIEKGKEIHTDVRMLGLLGKDIMLGNALVDMYAKCGAMAAAHGVLNELPEPNVVTWTALIAGYAQQGLSEEALTCFREMQEEGLVPDAVTFTCILKACSSIGAAKRGEEIHAEADRHGLLGNDIELGTALVDMYAKCGDIVKAQKVFDKLPAQNTVSWTALMAGYAQVGEVKRVVDLFNKLICQGVGPNGVTFLVLITGCGHAGLVEEGQMYYNIMNAVYCIVPTLDHSVCMVDLLSRAGHFDKAMRMIESVSPADRLLLWSIVMGVLQRWGNVELGRLMFEHAVHLDAESGAPYVCMSNIYAAAGMQEQAEEFEALSMSNVAWKGPGHSWWMDVFRNAHSFHEEFLG